MHINCLSLNEAGGKGNESKREGRQKGVSPLVKILAAALV